MLKLDPQGRLHVLIEDIHCHNLAPGYDSSFYGEAVGTGRGGTGDVVALWRISPDDEVQYVMSSISRPEPGVWIARDADNNSYSWHGEEKRISHIVKRSSDGSVSIVAGGEWGFQDGQGAEARFGSVGGIAAMPDGTLFVTDSGHLRRITPGGSVETVVRDLVSERTGGLPGDFGLFNRSVGVAVSPSGEVYVVDAYNLRVMRWNPLGHSGLVLDASNWLSRMTDGGLAWHPRGVAVVGPDIYVLESMTLPAFLADLVGTPRIRKISTDGNYVIKSVASWPFRILASVIPLTGILLALLWLRRRRTVRKRVVAPL